MWPLLGSCTSLGEVLKALPSPDSAGRQSLPTRTGEDLLICSQHLARMMRSGFISRDALITRLHESLRSGCWLNLFPGTKCLNCVRNWKGLVFRKGRLCSRSTAHSGKLRVCTRRIAGSTTCETCTRET
ncbi:hypothetical protein MLD38_020324 [Melastoma candidum]|uniref:Uncharacterized protein n=1 Tax=Melastoma candidum TaxID=119954 RepID=A0ACB9QEE9_9MYRT|nr:hypothetical protein MLD38_020324 [Melastoma candidum]